MSAEAPVVRAADGRPIPVNTWKANGVPRGVIQVLHGLGEHSGRYARFAKACNEKGYFVVAHDHRGHGESAEIRGHFADAAGWEKVIGDVGEVREWIAGIHPGLPLVLLGHSMGSFIAQCFAIRHPENLAALILSGSNYPRRLELHAGRALAGALGLVDGRSSSKLLNKIGFGTFNKPFEPARTEFDWLSRDEKEVDRYLADPLCGGVYTNRLWYDLTGGLLEFTSAGAFENLGGRLPVLITGGQNDPVGGQRSMRRLADAWRQSGHDVTLRSYDGGRHEMLNETNRDEVTANIIDWVTSIVTQKR